MDKEQQITERLKDSYSPVAIILHGSRAIGRERPRSDWDLVLLFEKKPILSSNREDVAGEDVEWKGFVLPVPQEEIFEKFGVVLQYARVLWEAGSAGTNLLRDTQAEYAKGAQLTDADRIRYRQFLLHKVHGLEDDKDTAYMFLRHLEAFFTRSTNWWFELLHDENRKPFYLAVPEIQKRDPEYYELLMTLCGESSKDKKIEAAREITKRLSN